MSCFIVSDKTISDIAQVAATKDKHDYKYLGNAFEKLGYNLSVDVKRLAQDLFNLNVDAFCERYPADDDAPEGQRTRYPEDLAGGFTFERNIHRSSNRAALIQAHKGASCLSYQCSEGDVPHLPLFKALEEYIHALEGHIVTSDPAWEVATWG